MKEVYIKPQLHVESFVLSQSVAQSCGYTDDKYYGKPLHWSIANCAWQEVDGTKIWTGTDNGCDGAYSADVEVSEGCYNAPSGTNQIFAS